MEDSGFEHMKNKKAATWAMESIGKMVISIVGFVIILAVLYQVTIGAQNESVEQACRSSIAIRANLKIDLKVTSINNIYPINCITQEKRIPEKLNNRNPGSEEAQAQIQKEIADMMVSCWWMFGQGHYYNILDDKWQNENLCHVCYSFTINTNDGFEKGDTIKKEDFYNYLVTHKYDPGLLRGGGYMIAANTYYDHPKYEDVHEETPMTIARLLNNRARLESGVLDLTDIYKNDAVGLNTLRQKLVEIANEYQLRPVFIIVPSFNEEQLQDNQNIPARIIEEWDIGNPDLNNALVFIFALKNGKMLYGAEVGAEAILPQMVMESIYEDNIETQIATQPAKAITDFGEALNDHLQSKKDIGDALSFQNTYSSYITGGNLGSMNSLGDAQGAIGYQKDFEGFVPGERYAIAYTAPTTIDWGVWGIGNLAVDFTKNTEYRVNMIAVSVHEDLFKEGAICNVNVED